VTLSASGARPLPLKFQIGARTIGAVRRDLIRVPQSLDDVLSGRVPALPPLDAIADGYLVTSLAAGNSDALRGAAKDMIAFERQRYTRRYTELSIGYDAYLDRLSSNTRSAMKRKANKIANASGGALDIRRFSRPDELAEFHRLARSVAVTTYQEKLMGSGLPDTPDFVQTMYRMAAAGNVRAWLLSIGGKPVAYLYCPIHSDTVIYEYVGHDPALNDLSPGAVLQAEALRDLFAESHLSRFDFTEGDGQHKRQFATGGVECVDLLLLRATIANRALLAALAGFDGGIMLAKAAVQRLNLQGIAKKVRRA
jgi:CelD/BcsL family acetyltransferase involved in cellulose biosynthesis